MILSQSTISRLSLADYNLLDAMPNLSSPDAFVIGTLAILVFALGLGFSAKSTGAKRSAFTFAVFWVLLAIILWSCGFFAPPCKLGAAPTSAISGAAAPPPRVSFDRYSQYKSFEEEDSPRTLASSSVRQTRTRSVPEVPTAGRLKRRNHKYHPLRRRKLGPSGAVDGRTYLGPARTRPEPADANDVVYRELELRTPKTSPFDEIRARDSLANMLSTNITPLHNDQHRVVGQFPQNASFP